MSPATKRRFTPAERFAVYTVHGEKCYLCTRAISLAEMHVDHVLPESLLDDPRGLEDTLEVFGLPDTFDVNSYMNWLPACSPCNTSKRSRVFRPAPIIAVQLQRAADGAIQASKLERKLVSERQVSRALNTLERAGRQGKLNSHTRSGLQSLLESAEPFRTQERAAQPLRVGPQTTVSHRIIQVSPDQKHALCMGSDGHLYTVDLRGHYPDLTDRGTQEGILRLIQEHLDVRDVWDHMDNGEWLVLASDSDGRVVELAHHRERWRAITYAFFRLPVNRTSDQVNVIERDHDVGLWLAEQQTCIYWFQLLPSGKYRPLGPEHAHEPDSDSEPPPPRSS